jgi:hypothetical protein
MQFVDTPFDDPEAFESFALANGMALQKIYDVMTLQSKIFTYYPLMDAADDSNWLLLLDQEMRSIYDHLGLTDLPDLASVDLRKQDEFEDFMLNYAQAITTVNASLGITS